MLKTQDIKTHWSTWAREFGQDIKATTRSDGIKHLEIQAILDAICDYFPNGVSSVLEAGCGNGVNCLAIQNATGAEVAGFDYVEEMIEAAVAKNTSDNVYFTQGDVTALADIKGLKEEYDLVLTCRCLINLPESIEKENAICELMKKVKKGGYLFLLENFQDSFSIQNKFRESLSLPAREVSSFNVFFDEDRFEVFTNENAINIVETRHFSGVHDLLQYVLLPNVNDGEVIYDHPIVKSLVELQLSNVDFRKMLNIPVGQNRLVVLEHV